MGGAPQESSRPDVFLITIDTLRADHVECYGYGEVRTPALNSLARDGVRFTAAFTPSPITNSSHATILTGDLPSTHGVTDFGIPIAANRPTWAELLKQTGYRTAAFIGAVILDSHSLAPGFDRGFDFFDHFPQDPTVVGRFGRVERRGMDVVQHAESWLDVHRKGRRFVWVHLYDPHDPYEPPAPYSKIYQARPYDGEIAYADSALEAFLHYLKKQGWYESSMIIAVADHGEGLGEHAEQTHGIFLYDSTLHVPLIIKLPRARAAGSVIRDQVRTTDILPTVLEVLGQGPGPSFDGESILPLLGREQRGDRAAFGETDYPLRFGWAPLRSVRVQGAKLIDAPRPEFYDLAEDAGELRNVYEPWNETVQKLRTILANTFSAARPGSQRSGAVGEKTIAELRALGYLGPEGATNVTEPSLLPNPKDKIEEQNLLHSAMIAADGHRFLDARTMLENIIRIDPMSVAAFVQLGQIEFRAGEYERAAVDFRRAGSLRPEDATIEYELGHALERSNELANARDALEGSLRLNPMNFEARTLLGSIYERLLDFAAAQVQFEAAILLEPENADAHLRLSRVLIQGQSDAALAELKEAARLRPGDPAIYEQLSQAYSRQGKKALAEKAARRAALLRLRKSP
jgi:choline-sulfatase